MEAGADDKLQLQPSDRLGAGEMTGPGLVAVCCPSCGDVYSASTEDVALSILCPCGRSFTAADLSSRLVGPKPDRRLDQPAASFKQAVESSTRGIASRTVAGAGHPQVPLPTQAGGTSFGKYSIVEEIARGGMGVVYRARQEGLNREVALKMLLAGEGATEEQVRRFLREAESAAKLSHPNIVPIYDVGVDQGRHYFTMEFVRGESIADVLDRMGMIPPRQALKIAHGVAAALQYAHENGILHRDIKPGNVMLAPRDDRSAPEPKDGDSIAFNSGLHGSYRVLVTDFGLAKDMGGDSVLTVSGTALGTPVYMSPEQAEGDISGMGPPSDVYSLGAVIYEMVTGAEPFEGASVGQILTKVIMTDPVLPRKRLPGLNRDVETIILTAMAKEPSRRYKSAAAMAEDIERYLKGEAISARPASIAYRLGRRIRRNKLAASFAALMVVVAIAAGIAVERNSAMKRREVLGETALRIAEGDFLAANGRYLDAERAFGEAIGLSPGFGRGAEGARHAKLSRLLGNASELLDDGNYKAAGFVLQEAGILDPENAEYSRLLRIQKGTATLSVFAPEEKKMAAWWIPAARGITWLQETMTFPLSSEAPAGVEALGDLPLYPSDRPFGDGTLILTRGPEVVAAMFVPVPRNSDVRIERRSFTAQAGTKDGLHEALRAATPGSVIELADGVHAGPFEFSVPGLTIKAAAGARPVLRSEGDLPVMKAADSPGLRVEGLVFEATGKGCLEIAGSPGCVVAWCSFSGGKGTLLQLSACQGAVVLSCDMRDCLEPGLSLGSCHDAVVAGNHVRNVGWAGAYLPCSDRLLFARNHVHHAQRMSVYTHKAADLAIVENVVHHNPQWGIIVGEETMSIRVEGNFVHDTEFPRGEQRAEGIVMVMSAGSGACIRNTVFRSTTGIRINEAHGVRTLDNIVFDCATGMHWQSAGPVDFNCFWNNRVMAQWVDKRVKTLKEMQEVFAWQGKKQEHGQESDPRFVDPASGDYSLGPESPCKGAASDGRDMGADFSLVKEVMNAPMDVLPWLCGLQEKRLAACAAAARSAMDDDAADAIEARARMLYR